MLGVYLFSSGIDTPVIASGITDKLLHAAAYCVFGFLNLRAFHGGIRPMRQWPTLLAMILTLSYGAVDEWHQSLIPARVASVHDWLADAVGAGLSLVGLWAAVRLRQRRNPGR